MKKANLTVFFGLACTALAVHAQSVVPPQQAVAPFQLVRTIALDSVSGRFDHLAIDSASNRLFIAATGNHSVEVIDLRTDKVQQSITGLGKPHGLAWIPSTESLYVADGTLAELRVYRGSPLALVGTIKLSDDADDMVYDEANHLLFVGHGGSDAANPARVAVVDTTTFKLIANVPVASHPEALDIDPQTGRVFVNVADSNEVAVLFSPSAQVIAHWKLISAADNVPLAFDVERQSLYIACRKPGIVIALNAATGKEISNAPTADGADDLFYDAASRRVYVITGSGEVDAFQVDDAQLLHPIGVQHTAAGAKTALFVPAQHLLYVGVPGAGAKHAEIRVFATPVEKSK